MLYACTHVRESIATETTISDVTMIMETGGVFIISGRAGAKWIETAMIGKDLLSMIREDIITETGTGRFIKMRTDPAMANGTNLFTYRQTPLTMEMGADK
jgi:hypothetical protein